MEAIKVLCSLKKRKILPISEVNLSLLHEYISIVVAELNETTVY